MGILQMTPLSLTAASALFLGEHVGWRRWTAVAIGFTGALLVIKPGSSAFNAWALLGVLSVLCGTMRDVSTRRLDVALSPLLIMMLSQIVVAAVGAWLLGVRDLEGAEPCRAPRPGLRLGVLARRPPVRDLFAALGRGGRRRSLPLRRHRLVDPARLPDLASAARCPLVRRYLDPRVRGLYTFYREQQLRRQRSRQPS